MNHIPANEKPEQDKQTNKQYPLDNYSVPSKNEGTDKEKESPYYKSQAPSISLPKGGGALKSIDEKFSVNAVNGTTSLEIPLPITPGRNGFTPAISLQYNSGGGNSEFGLGWNASIPSIQRKTDKKLPEYNDAVESDIFLLAGAEDLVPITDTNGSIIIDTSNSGYSIKCYRPRIEGLFARIEFITDVQTNEKWWRVITKDNIATYYGLTQDGRVADPAYPNRVYKWLPQLVVDNKGSVHAYYYVRENTDNVPFEIHEKNRHNAQHTNLYLKRVKYCNKSNWYINEADILKPVIPNISYLMELVLDYGDHEDYSPVVSSTTKWSYRKDAFSDFHAGFEIRTYRKCKRVMMFHYFKELKDESPVPATLVGSLDFVYQHDNEQSYFEADYITSITRCGYRRNSSGYIKKSFPSFQCNYQPLSWNTDLVDVDSINTANAPQGLTGDYQWIDFFGEGISGILTEQSGEWYYKRNNGDGNFDKAKVIASKPAVAGLGNSWQWQDLDANGMRQVVNRSNDLPGYFQLSDEQDWEPFRSFRNNVNIDWSDPYTKMLDLDGDGKADVLLTQDDIFTWFKNEGKDGFVKGGRRTTANNEEKGPRLLLNDNKQSVFLADMNGDGLTDLVRIKNGEVCYWPNMGFGRFGSKVTMSDVPVFDKPDNYNPQYLTLADISGTGAADILYLGRDKCTAWINLAGNAFSEPVDIHPLPAINKDTQIAIIDFLGNGTGCIVWSSALPQHGNLPIRYIDLMGGKKPYLMSGYDNGMGKVVSFEYKSSTHFYLDDEKASLKWATKLPFPVHCLKSVTVADIISQTEHKQTYAYHHGYYDHEEREFRGFGRVDVKDEDSATIDTNNELNQAPVLTKTWYHTGAWLREKKLLDAFAEEYYNGGSYLSQAPQHISLSTDRISGLTPEQLTIAEKRQAYRALKGLPLRQEVYALDGNVSKQYHPYSVTSYAYCTEIRQRQMNNKFACYYSYQEQQVAWHYERESGDPRVLHDLTLEVDTYGNVLQSAQVAYPRNSALLSTLILPQVVEDTQAIMLATYNKANLTNDIDTLQYYRLRIPYETRSYQLHNLDIPSGLWDKDALKTACQNATSIDYAAVPGSGAKKRLLSHGRVIFKSFDTNTVLYLGTINYLAIEHERYQLAYTYYEYSAGTYKLRSPEYDTLVSIDMLKEGKYRIHLNSGSDVITGFPTPDSNNKEDKNIWLPGGTFSYDNPATTGTVEQPADTFYLPFRYTDPWGNHTDITYWESTSNDKYYLLPRTVTDAKGNTTTVNAYDWRCMQPLSVTDANDNINEVIFDTLCIPVAMVAKGKGTQGDTAEYIDTSINPSGSHVIDPEVDSAIQADFWDDPQTEGPVLLGKATWRCLYRFDIQLDSQARVIKCPSVAMIAREKHNAEFTASPVLIRLSYSDGFGRVAMHKVQAANDPSNNNERWVGSGKTVYNNKGKAVMQYEPYYSTTHEYDIAEQASSAGVSPKVFYDPLARAYRTEMPDGTFAKTEWSAWEQIAHDNNDTVLDSDWYDVNIIADNNSHPGVFTYMNDAAQKAAVHHNTPTTMHLDTLARPFFTRQVNAWKDANNNIQTENLDSYVELDIAGNQLAVHDARGNTALTYQYNQLNAVISQLSIDSGQQYMLTAVDGQPLYAWDADEREFYFKYDELRRPIEKWIVLGNTHSATDDFLLEKMIYGESVSSAETYNLKGKLYKHYDGAGLMQAKVYDFKGNPLSAWRTFVSTYDERPNWRVSTDSDLEATAYVTEHSHDALNRLKSITHKSTANNGSSYTTHGKTNYSYDKAGLLKSVDISDVSSAVGTSTHLATDIINSISYDAKGQRTKVAYENGATTEYSYDAKTFRVARIYTHRPKSGGGTDVLQDLNYWYDPVGSITTQTDAAHQTIYYNNTVIDPHNYYTYDALYRLIKAEGRELIGNDAAVNYNDSSRMGKTGIPFNNTSPNDTNAMRRYTQKYTYDNAGNMTQMKHIVGGTDNWTRNFTIATSSNKTTVSSIGSNATTSETLSYDARGNLTGGLNHLISSGSSHADTMVYNAENRLEKVLIDATNIRAYYQYDAGGQRVRKVWKNTTGNLLRIRLYIGDWELYIDKTGSTINIQRETLHVMDDRDRVALIDTPTVDNIHSDPELQCIRYQFSNHLGTASLELDENAAIISYEEYYPYGSTSFQTGRSGSEVSLKRYRFTGKERDEETGLYYHGARYHCPWLARWCAVDPLQANMPTWSGYNYGFCNPIKWIDPDGREPKVKHQGADPLKVKTHSDQDNVRHAPIINKLNVAPKTPKLPEEQVLMADIHGDGHIGPKREVERKVAAIKQERINRTGENIANGPFGALGYILGGDKGSDVGAHVDQVSQGAYLHKEGIVGEPYKTRVEIKEVPKTENKFESIKPPEKTSLNGVEFQVTLKNNQAERNVDIKPSTLQDKGYKNSQELGLSDGMLMDPIKILEVAQEFLGKGYKEVEHGKGRYISSDGTRAFRMGTNDILGNHGGGPHVNFETLIPNPAKPGKMMVNENIHVYILGK